MKRRYEQYLIALVIIVISFTLFGCAKDEPIKIGFIAGLSGRVADLGVSGRNGVMLALEHQNARGGIDGRLVELVVRDDQQNPDMAKQGVKELLDQNVELIIGPMTSSMAMAVVPLVNNSRICLLSPTVATTDLLDKDDNFLRVISTTKDYATKSAIYQFNKLGHRRVAAIYDLNNKSYTESWLKNFKEAFEGLGGEVLKVTGFKSGNDVAFYDSVKKLLKTDPDLFLIITNAVDAALICQQVRKINNKVTIVMSEWASTERYVELAGSAAEDVYIAQFLDRNDESKTYQAFWNTYKERFGQTPGFAGLAGYDAALVVLEALSKQKQGESIKEAILRQKRFQCVQQVITINRFGDADRTTFITKIHDENYLTVE